MLQVMPACGWYHFPGQKDWRVTGAGWAGYSLEKHQEVYFGHRRSLEMSVGHSKWRWQVGRWLFKSAVQRSGLEIRYLSLIWVLMTFKAVRVERPHWGEIWVEKRARWGRIQYLEAQEYSQLLKPPRFTARESTHCHERSCAMQKKVPCVAAKTDAAN